MIAIYIPLNLAVVLLILFEEKKINLVLFNYLFILEILFQQ